MPYLKTVGGFGSHNRILIGLSFAGLLDNGVIVIHTRTSLGTSQYFEEAPAGIHRYKHPGYYKAREFYSLITVQTNQNI